MNRRLKIMLIGVVAAMGITGGAAVLHAQSGDGWKHDARMGGHHGGMKYVCENGSERLDDVITFADIRLGIRDDQQATWDSFAASVRAGGQDLLSACDSMDVMRGGNAPERLAEMEVIMEKALGALKQIRTSFDPLYTVLDEDQKATLERLTHRRHGRYDDDDDHDRDDHDRDDHRKG
ncbi:MAG: Spy/CpxP family protein refolding chaperone [Minwuia sp.]|nr:Spy/CpxP family protein refolding chaperone [Minwuia sp.]